MAPALDKTAWTWRALPPGSFTHLRQALGHYGHHHGGFMLGDGDLTQAGITLGPEWQSWCPFTLVLTDQLQVLLVRDGGAATPEWVGITCRQAAIAPFLAGLIPLVPPEIPWLRPLQVHLTTPNPAPFDPLAPALEEVFLSLGAALKGGLEPEPPLPPLPALIQAIHHCPDLATLWATTLTGLQDHLALSQAALYGFTRPLEPGTPINPTQLPPGDWWYPLAPGPREPLEKAIPIPVGVGERPWGALILWPQGPWDGKAAAIAAAIAEHLAIAHHHLQRHQALRAQADTLEQYLTMQTQDLRDALIAAQSASRAKSEFLATMSHELRTPLTCIIGMSATLLRWSFGDLTPRQRDYLTTIHQSGEHLLALINDILELSKIESGRTVLEITPLSLATLSRQCWEAFREQAAAQDIEITCDLGSLGGQEEFWGDARRIRQILANLLSNALKFTEAGGQVNLRVRREQQGVVFQVEDTGIGISETQQSRLFETFQQLEAGPQRQYQGTGLGLALTKQLVELHGGSITVTSRPGVGSVFTVRLPNQIPLQSPVPTSPVPAPPPPTGGRIILVEDREDVAGMICDLLTAADYQVIWIIEGSRVVEQVALLQPALVLVNLQLDTVEGYHIIQSLRDSLVTRTVKILGLNGTTSTPGTDALLPNPFTPEHLLDQIQALLHPPRP